MAHSKRDLINEERAKRAEGVGADPGIEVGGTQHGSTPPYADDPSKHLVGLLHEAGIDIHPDTVGDDPIASMGREAGDIVIHNAEQVSVMQDLERLIHDTDAVIAMAKVMRDEDESLYRQDVEWDYVGCAGAERWIDNKGDLGWRVYIGSTDTSATKFLAYVGSKLGAMGWDGIVTEAVG